MPLFQRENTRLSLVKPKNFINEKEMQALIEDNLGEIFNCRFIATEFSTGPIHAGRIDTLALSEENNPVIIEYKVVESSQLVNQSLYYLSWIKDHRGDFEIAVQQAFPEEEIEVDWSDIRVICIAPEYKKYDLHAVQMMGSNIELWQFRYFENGSLFFEEIYKRSVVYSGSATEKLSSKNPVMVEAGRKAALTRATAVYSIEKHIEKIDDSKKGLIFELEEYIISLDDSVEEVPKKFYIAYKVSQNFVCMEIHKTKILLYLKIDPKTLDFVPDICRDVTNIGHFGTGDFEVTVKSESDMNIAKEYILLSFKNIGGN
jgi:predicted transport protein